MTEAQNGTFGEVLLSLVVSCLPLLVAFPKTTVKSQGTLPGDEED